MKKILLLIFTINLFAQDSTKIYQLSEVEILGDKLNLKINQSPFSVSIIESKEIELFAGAAIGKILNGVSGLFLKSYGGTGSVETISLRGFGSEYVVVLIDGERVSSFQNGIFELGNFTSKDIEKIEILKGGASSIFGANAVGGVINIVTKKYKNKINLNLGFGSNLFESKFLKFNITDFKFQINEERGRNNYDFIFNDGIKNYELKRLGADYLLQNISVKYIPDLKNKYLEFSIMLNKSNRGMPEAVTSQYAISDARFWDENYFVNIKYKSPFNDELNYYSTLNYNQTFNNYSDKISNNIINESSKNYVLNYNTGLNYNYSENLISSLNLDFTNIKIIGSNLETHIRNQIGVNLNLIHKNVFISDLTIVPSFKKEYYSDFENATAFQIGGNYKLFEETFIRINYSKNYRTPTFNDLFWKFSGNKNLKRENSFQSEFGASSNFNLFNQTKIDLAIFNISSIDRIVWLPWKNGLWRPENISSVNSKGIELEINKTLINNHLFADFNFTNFSTIRTDFGELKNKQLAYIPNLILNLSLYCVLENYEFKIIQNYTGERFANENNAARSIMKEIYKTTIIGKYNYEKEKYYLSVIGEVDNLFDFDYEIIKAFPMQKRIYKLTFSITYK